MIRPLTAFAFPLVALALLPGTARAQSARPYDFNGDGRQDLVAGLSVLVDADRGYTGPALVLAGRPRGVSLRPQLIAPAVPGASFGLALASADFDGDGYADLAGGDLNDTVTVIYGARTGLAGGRAQLIPGGTAMAGDFGFGLVAGDFDADGFADLAVGAPGEDASAIPGNPGSGAVHLLFGGPAGLTRVGERRLARPLRDRLEFGRSLAVGDVNGDARLDLVEGASGSNDEGLFPGHSSFCPGTRRGPIRCRAMRHVGAARSEQAAVGPNSLSVGDVTGDGYQDVVQGVSYASFGDLRGGEAGEVRVWRGTRRGPSRRAMVITQNRSGVPGHNEPGDGFGSAVAVARLDRDRYADIVIGAPGEDNSAGSVTIIRGAPSGQARTGNVALERGHRGLPGPRHARDAVGLALSLLDVNGDHHPDLAVGAPGRGASLIVARGRPRHRRFVATKTAQSLGLADLGMPSATAFGFGSLLGRVGSS